MGGGDDDDDQHLAAVFLRAGGGASLGQPAALPTASSLIMADSLSRRSMPMAESLMDYSASPFPDSGMSPATLSRLCSPGTYPGLGEALSMAGSHQQWYARTVTY